LLADAGLNLNNGAFLNLRTAVEQTGFLAGRGLICEVYPAKVRQDHLDFLRAVGNPYVGVGLQSFDSAVLAQVERKYDEARFEQTLHALGEVAKVAVEVIMGLPGDAPENFLRNFERARRLPCALRVYHCVVLPSALMVRSPPEHALDYDSVSLKMRSCLGWPRAALAAEAEFLDREAARSGQSRRVLPGLPRLCARARQAIAQCQVILVRGAALARILQRIPTERQGAPMRPKSNGLTQEAICATPTVVLKPSPRGGDFKKAKGLEVNLVRSHANGGNAGIWRILDALERNGGCAPLSTPTASRCRNGRRRQGPACGRQRYRRHAPATTMFFRARPISRMPSIARGPHGAIKKASSWRDRPAAGRLGQPPGGHQGRHARRSASLRASEGGLHSWCGDQMRTTMSLADR
jgi:hypothetical protein